MKNSYTVVSRLADASVREIQPDTEYRLFENLTQLELYLTTKPIRCTTLFLSKDILGSTINISLNALANILENKFFSTDRIIYITDYMYEEQSAINFIQERITHNIEVIRGNLSRDFVTSLLTGNLQQDDITPEKLARLRIKKASYVKERLESDDAELSETYISDDLALKGVSSVEITAIDNMTREGQCKLINITGLRSLERTSFAFMLGQYLSVQGKTIIIESDFEYLTLSDMVVRSGLEALLVNVEDWYDKPDEIIPLIRNTSKRLICIVSTSGKKFDYNFLQQLIYSNLSEYISYMVLEYDLDFTNSMQEYVVVMPNNIVKMIETLHNLRIRVSPKTRFACVEMTSISELAVRDQSVIGNLIQEILQIKSMPLNISIYTLNSLQFGGKIYDLQTYISE